MFIGIMGVVVALVAAIVAGLAAHLAGRFISPQVRQDFREGSGLVNGIVGTLFAISVGLVVVAAWNQVNSATQTTSTEASNLTDVYWYSRSLPEAQRETLRRVADEYANTVIRQEWPLMAEQHTLSQAAWRSSEQLRAFFQTIEPATSAASTRYGQAMSRMQAVLDARRARAQMADTGVPPLLWIALAGCGLIAVLPAVVCGGPVRRAHITMAAVVGGLVGMVLFLVYQLDFPFSGGVTISPAAFEQALERFASIRSMDAG
ncbi:DUF4239 domain-containing protein [Nonomuraea sp. NPDC050404]|uniref:bestrophin-like domain n=1 Tax=Nonomuraea sp. NPDC050404 TaxID=3155783 RepID=UPI0033FF8E8C